MGIPMVCWSKASNRRGSRRRSTVLTKVSSCLLAASLIASVSCVYAHSGNSSVFNLGSRVPTATAGSLGDTQPVAIRVGNRIMTVSPGTLLTPAEQVALRQVLDSGRQTLILSAAGTARGGTLQLND